MRDYGDLVGRLRICPDYNDGCKNCPHEHDLGCRSTTMREAADAIEELQKSVELEYQSGFADGQISANRKKNRWISVEERLPEFDQKVLAWVKNKSPEARFNHDDIYIAELKDRTPEPDPEGKKNFWGIPGYDSEWTVWAWSYFSEPEVTHWMPLPEPPKEEANA